MNVLELRFSKDPLPRPVKRDSSYSIVARDGGNLFHILKWYPATRDWRYFNSRSNSMSSVNYNKGIFRNGWAFIPEHEFSIIPVHQRLRLCPFCGGDAEVIPIEVNGKGLHMYTPQCTNNHCMARLKPCRTAEEAARSWNATRSEDLERRLY